MGCVVYLYLTVFWQAGGGANGRRVTGSGRVGAQQPARTLSGINTPHIPSPLILHPPDYEDGTDRGFRNVGYYNCDVGELPKRKHIT